MNNIDRIGEYDALKRNLFYHSMNDAPVSNPKTHLSSALEAIESLQARIAETEKLIRVLRSDIDSRVLNAEIDEELTSALRQFRHNTDNSKSFFSPGMGFVVAYDKALIDHLIGGLKARIAELESEQSESIDSEGAMNFQKLNDIEYQCGEYRIVKSEDMEGLVYEIWLGEEYLTEFRNFSVVKTYIELYANDCEWITSDLD